MLYGIIVRIVKTQTLAEEILQDTFLKIWNNIDSYDEEKGRLFTWMLNIARNHSLDKLRSKEIKSNQRTDDIYMVSEISAFEKIAPETLDVKEVIKSLPPEQKLLIDLMYFEGYSQSEISEEFGIPLGTVKTRVRSAISKLRILFN